MLTVVTGATGFVGGRLASRLRDNGDPVRALVRNPDRARHLSDQGVDLVAGDITDMTSLNTLVDGAATVFHCAAILGDDPNPDIRRVNVDGTRALLGACASHGVRRFVYLSSLAVLGARHHHGTDESAPRRRARDAYTNTKIEAEEMVTGFGAEHGLEVVVLRPGFVYGPGDRLFLPRLIDSLERRQFAFVGDGSKILNTIYVDDLVQALLRARDTRDAAGETYNLTDGAATSLRDFVTILSEQLDLPPPARHVPPPLAWMVCYAMELTSRLTRSTTPPRLNLTRMKFLYYNQDYSIDKARRELRYAPQFGPRAGLAEAVRSLDGERYPVGLGATTAGRVTR